MTQHRKAATLSLLLLLATCAVAVPMPDEYPINIHINSSYLLFANGGASQIVKVTINGKKYKLSAITNGTYALLALGDYKAKLIKDEHKPAYESDQAYEFLFPDKKTRRFFVIGQSE